MFLYVIRIRLYPLFTNISKVLISPQTISKIEYECQIFLFIKLILIIFAIMDEVNRFF